MKLVFKCKNTFQALVELPPSPELEIESSSSESEVQILDQSSRESLLSVCERQLSPPPESDLGESSQLGSSTEHLGHDVEANSAVRWNDCFICQVSDPVQ